LATRKTYVGFYWTRPAPRVGFIDIPADVDAAAATSRTIRYQRDLVRRWVETEKGALIAEYAALDVAPDRDTDAIADEVRRAVDHALSHDAIPVVVDFLANANWRPQRPMQRQLSTAGVDVERLYPAPSSSTERSSTPSRTSAHGSVSMPPPHGRSPRSRR
jgi:hypothetical protein